jgi:hypothetical protein
MAGLVPAIHAAPPQIPPAQTSVGSEAYEETAEFSGMAGSKPGHDGKLNAKPNQADVSEPEIYCGKLEIS